jgi:hypothetical protein
MSALSQINLFADFIEKEKLVPCLRDEENAVDSTERFNFTVLFELVDDLPYTSEF